MASGSSPTNTSEAEVGSGGAEGVDEIVGLAESSSDGLMPNASVDAMNVEQDNENQESTEAGSNPAFPDVVEVEEMLIEDDFVPRRNPDLVGVDFEIPQDNGFGGVSEDESDADGDPNENVQNDYVYEEANEWDAESAGTHSTDRLSRDTESEEEEDPPPDFDQQLPARHMYLGEAMEELQGRVLLEDDSVLEIPIVVMNFHLIPGQTLPMTLFHAVFQNAIRRCILNERVFGVVHSGVENMDGRTVVSRNALGTLAEIYEFQEEIDVPIDIAQVGGNFALKAKGRQRFNVLEVRRQADGNLMAKVRIRPEIQLPPLMSHVVSNATMRFHFPTLSSCCPSVVKVVDVERRCAEGDMELEEQKVEEVVQNVAVENLGEEIRRRRPVSRYYSALTPWPHFVYENYDERILVERVHKKLRNELRGLTESHANVPLDATELSFWLAQNLTMDDGIRLQILKMDSAIQRLRFELNLLDNVVSMRREQGISWHSLACLQGGLL